jgi:ribose transport system permease protein
MTVGRLSPAVKEFARGTALGIPNLLWAMPIVPAVIHYLLCYTHTDRYLCAPGSNAEAARRQGINTLKVPSSRT